VPADGAGGSPRAVRRTPVSPLGLDIGAAPRHAVAEGAPAAASLVVTRPLLSCLIATTPRTGSWLLADLLAAIGLVGQPQEFFRQDFVKTFSRKLGLDTTEITAAYLDGIFASASPGTGVFSAKLQPFDFTRLRSALSELTPELQGADLISRWIPDPRYIHLTRRDRGRQAISWYRALMSNVWWAFRDTSAEEERPRYPDLLQVRWLEDQIALDEQAWAAYFDDNGLAAHEVVYEDIVDDPDGSVRKVLDFLQIDVPDHLTIPPSRLEQMANTDTELWLQAYNVVRDQLPPKPDKWFWSLDWGAFVPPSEG
jgi:LPS sulfotransferase NodH